ncbi:Myb-like domain [Phytophthora cinnamomi]|uniref:Myb-like domain n=1 Tax=Phytophthora cinnamomi TaxID=4785 RepID=UPI0035596756|nr:Myb-like domain [Phytophthora cinnamomi]
MTSMQRSASVPLRPRARTRYASVLESALVGLGREDAVVQSTRKLRKKRRVQAGHSPVRGLEHAFSAPARRPKAADEEEEDPFARLKLLKPHKKKKKRREEAENGSKAFSPAVTRSAAKLKSKRRERHAGVLEMMTRTPVTRSMMKQKKWKRSSLERIEDIAGLEEEKEEEEEVVVQKKLSFQSPAQSPEPVKKKRRVREEKEEEDSKKENKKPLQEGGRVNRKAVVLQQWRPEWPPVVEADGGLERAQLVLIGLVDGEVARFVVGKREGPTRFTSKDGQYVSLSGKFDRAAARSAGVPRDAMSLMKEGIPAYFYKRLLPFVDKAQSAARPGKAERKAKSAKKNTSGDADDSPPSTPIHDDDDSASEAPFVPSPKQDDDVYETPKPKKARAPALIKENNKNAKKDQPEPEAEVDVWTAEQLEALTDAKLKIPTTASNFWAQVALYVPGKAAKDCQTKTFEQFRSPPTHRKPAKKAMKRANTEANLAIPTKIARAGSNKFKKQVREFVEEYEKKHVDDLFETTPSKEGLPELPDFGLIKSPEFATPSHSLDEDSEVDDEAPGLLKKLSSRRRDDIDSYVLGINRQHVAGGGVMAGGKVRRVTSMVTPVKGMKPKPMSAKKKAVMIVEEVGSHSLKGIVSPGGTTHVRIEKDGSSSEGEDEDDYRSSDEEEGFDVP